MAGHRPMRVVRRAFGADGFHFSSAVSVGRQPEAQLQASRGILRLALGGCSHFDCSSERRSVKLGVARVVRPVAHGASSHRQAEAASLYSSLYGGTSPRVQVVRGRAAAAQGPSALGVGPMRVRRAVTAAHAVPLGARATVYAPRPLGVESSGSAAPLPASCYGESAALGLRLGQSRLSAARSGRLRGRVVRLASSPRRSRDVQLCLLLSSYIILCGSATCVCSWPAAGPRPHKGHLYS